MSSLAAEGSAVLAAVQDASRRLRRCDLGRSLYWRSRRQTSYWTSSRPLCRGTSPTMMLAARGGHGGSRQIGPAPVYSADCFRTQKTVQGGQRRRQLLSTLQDYRTPCPRVM